ncbi:MAG: GNAT family N-acetyltransferase [archaeon]
MNIKIIKSEEEIKKVIPLFQKVFAEPPHNDIWSTETAFKCLSRIYNHEGQEYCLYAEEDKEVVGLLFSQIEICPTGNYLYVYFTGVAETARKKGVGTMLLKKLEEVAKKNNIVKIDLMANKKGSGYNFWQKRGLKQTDYIHMHKKI